MRYVSTRATTKIQGRQKLFKPLWIQLKYLDDLEKYQTCPKILLLHLVAFKIISRVYYFEFLKVLLGGLFELIYH
jgi:hypothetical protein